TGSGDVISCDPGTADKICIIVKGLSFDTPYNVALKATYGATVDGVAVSLVDFNTKVLSHTTPGSPPYLVPDSATANFAPIGGDLLPRLFNADTDNVASTLNALSIGQASFQDIAYTYPPELSLPADVLELVPKGGAFGTGDVLGSASPGVRLGIYDYTRLG